MNKEIIKKYLLDFQERKFADVKPRDFTLSDSSKIQTIIGARRTGKTYLLYNKILELEKFGVKRNQVIYLNFENPILDDFSYKEIKNIIDVHWSIFPETTNKKLYLFIDEPQVIQNWERAIRSIYDDYNLKIFLTGSSSRLLSKEVATSLRGRSISFILLTLSFKEFLRFNGFKYNPKRISSKKEAMILKYFNIFIESGAYPEIVLERNKENEIKILQDYLGLTLYRDLIERYSIKNTNLMKMLIDLVVTSDANEFSIHKHYLDLKSRGLKIGKDTMYEYFSHLEDSFFVFLLKKFSYSRKTENLSTPKIYLSDIGFLNLYSLENFGARLENIVFLELLRRINKNSLQHLNYWKSVDGYEVDFLISENKKIKQAIQVSLKIENRSTKEREMRALLSCLNEFDLKEGIILTKNESNEEKIDGKIIKTIPIWKWLLEI